MFVAAISSGTRAYDVRAENRTRVLVSCYDRVASRDSLGTYRNTRLAAFNAPQQGAVTQGAETLRIHTKE